MAPFALAAWRLCSSLRPEQRTLHYRFFYASSACIYPEGKQLNTEVEGGGLKEADAWPAQPQDAYGLEKLASEEICRCAALASCQGCAVAHAGAACRLYG